MTNYELRSLLEEGLLDMDYEREKDWARRVRAALAEEPRDAADCPKCGEWRDGEWTDCANCGFEPHPTPCSDDTGSCLYVLPHSGPHKVPPDWAIVQP